jgi:hypothetical protein
MEHPAAHGIVNTTSACVGRAIFDQDSTPVGDPATYFFSKARQGAPENLGDTSGGRD